MIAAMTTTTKLSGWLVQQGAPELPEGLSYRLYLEPADRTADYSPSKVTAYIYDGDTLVTQATEITRDSSALAAVAAARHASQELDRVRLP